MFRRILANRRARTDARNRFFAAENLASRLLDQLADTADPGLRGPLLRKVADQERLMGRVHATAFGPDVIQDGDGTGRNVAECLLLSALLGDLVADVEYAVAYPKLGRRNTTTQLERHAGEVLDRMAATPDLADRALLLADLYEAVLPAVGGQAAEVIACLPSPGMVGWRVEERLPQATPPRSFFSALRVFSRLR